MDIVKKLFTGATDEENRKNKARMREIFNEAVKNGDQYQLIYCHSEDYTDAVVVKVTKHSNFIVGYKEWEVVVIAVDSSLQHYEAPVIFNKANGSTLEKTWAWYCVVANQEVGFQLEPITYAPWFTAAAKYSLAVTQSSEEVSAFRNFFKQWF